MSLQLTLKEIPSGQTVKVKLEDGFYHIEKGILTNFILTLNDDGAHWFALTSHRESSQKPSLFAEAAQYAGVNAAIPYGKRYGTKGVVIANIVSFAANHYKDIIHSIKRDSSMYYCDQSGKKAWEGPISVQV